MNHDPVERTAAWVREARLKDLGLPGIPGLHVSPIVELKVVCDTSAALDFLGVMLMQIKDSFGLTYEQMRKDFLPDAGEGGDAP